MTDEPREPQGREAEVLAARRASLERLGRERAFAITPPRNSPSAETTSKFVPVPKSTTIAGPPNRVKAARAFTTRSAPTSRGLSVRTGTPVFVPGPTIRGSKGR